MLSLAQFSTKRLTDHNSTASNNGANFGRNLARLTNASPRKTNRSDHQFSIA
jgi:hypothetical protein